MSLRPAVMMLFGAAAGAAVTIAYGQNAPPSVARETPPFRSLDANLYMQTSAEYRACCLQAFVLAETRLAEKVKARPAGGKPAAVVLDLDETVLDNGGFQAMMIRSGLAYDQRLWDIWEEKHGADVGLVPGVKEFLSAAKGLGVAPVYITNRNEKFRSGVKVALEKWGVAVPDEQLLLATTTSDKTARRAKAAEAFDVLLLVGDNLRDFDDVFKFDPAAGIPGRKAKVDDLKGKFGTDWVILPNPAYGEWLRPLGKGLADLDQLVPSKTP